MKPNISILALNIGRSYSYSLVIQDASGSKHDVTYVAPVASVGASAAVEEDTAFASYSFDEIKQSPRLAFAVRRICHLLGIEHVDLDDPDTPVYDDEAETEGEASEARSTRAPTSSSLRRLTAMVLHASAYRDCQLALDHQKLQLRDPDAEPLFQSRVVGEFAKIPLVTGAMILYGGKSSGKTTAAWEILRDIQANDGHATLIEWGEPDGALVGIASLHAMLHELIHLSVEPNPIVILDSARELAYMNHGVDDRTAEGGVSTAVNMLLTRLSMIGRKRGVCIIIVMNPMTTREERLADRFEAAASSASGGLWLSRRDDQQTIEFDVRAPDGRVISRVTRSIPDGTAVQSKGIANAVFFPSLGE